MTEKKFIEQSLRLFKRYNEHQLFYNGGFRYDKLISPEPLHITPQQYQVFKDSGQKVLNSFLEQKKFFREAFVNDEYSWLTDMLKRDMGPKAYDFQVKMSRKDLRLPKISRADLSSLDFKAHEIQSRWASLGYLHYLGEVFDQEIPLTKGEKNIRKGLLKSIMKLVDHHCTEDGEIAIILAPNKYSQEISYLLQNEGVTDRLISSLPHRINSERFIIKNNKLIKRDTKQVVRLILRRELTLVTLSNSKFGQSLINLALDDNLAFEPDLDIINDTKVGMALAYDGRTNTAFSDETRDIFLKTSLFDENLTSFNSVFNSEYTSLQDFVARATKSKRKYIFKYAGSNLKMSFGGSHVFRLDKNAPEKLINNFYHPNHIWILQELDKTRFKANFLKGDYTKAETLEVATAHNFAARIKAFYYLDKDHQELVDLTANLVNDHWKARSKTSDQPNGLGTVTTVIRVRTPKNNKHPS